MKTTLMTLLFATSAFALVCSSASAQESDQEAVQYDFEEDVIDGSTKSPEELYIKGLKGSKVGTLITIRKDFKREIVKSSEGI